MYFKIDIGASDYASFIIEEFKRLIDFKFEMKIPKFAEFVEQKMFERDVSLHNGNVSVSKAGCSLLEYSENGQNYIFYCKNNIQFKNPLQKKF